MAFTIKYVLAMMPWHAYRFTLCHITPLEMSFNNADATDCRQSKLNRYAALLLLLLEESASLWHEQKHTQTHRDSKIIKQKNKKYPTASQKGSNHFILWDLGQAFWLNGIERKMHCYFMYLLLKQVREAISFAFASINVHREEKTNQNKEETKVTWCHT